MFPRLSSCLSVCAQSNQDCPIEVLALDQDIAQHTVEYLPPPCFLWGGGAYALLL